MELVIFIVGIAVGALLTETGVYMARRRRGG
jgi:hypothetical protein